MATTRIIRTYKHKNQTNKTTIAKKILYITNEDKIQSENKIETNKLISTYECSKEIAADEFAISISNYERNTGRSQKDNSILVYHIRQSFKPGEVDPATANEIGHKLALEFTKGEHAFIVATHTDRPHIHNHIIVNAINLNCDGKFDDPWRSGKKDIARISDKLCEEYWLSVVKHKTKSLYERTTVKTTKEHRDQNAVPKPITAREQLQNIIEECLKQEPKDFDNLLKLLEQKNCFAKRRGKNISITTPFSGKPIRLNSLSEDFKQERLIQLFANKNNKSTEKSIEKKSKYETPKTGLQLMIDIKNSQKATENIGYRKWAGQHNLQQMSKLLIFMERHNLTYEDLEKHVNEKSQKLQNIKNEVAAIDDKMKKITELQSHIGAYSKTKEIYKQYKQSKNKDEFKKQHQEAINTYEKAQQYFAQNNYGFGSDQEKLPRMQTLKQEWMELKNKKHSLWSNYKDINSADKEHEIAYKNIRVILNKDSKEKEIPNKTAQPLLDKTEQQEQSSKKQHNKNNKNAPTL
ncbi:MAG: relaxase/mobilization nuclease domain-containing protein [Defluviitaleaceae bacterium]|nr:relaxase/mobilization nuclease domain-containing protein [Defluviitaleaceae bacterium]